MMAELRRSESLPREELDRIQSERLRRITGTPASTSPITARCSVDTEFARGRFAPRRISLACLCSPSGRSEIVARI